MVEHRGADLQVIACAGSGKTESVSRRIAELLVEDARPESIIAFTFTDRAAAELKERIMLRTVDRLGEESLGPVSRMFIGTIHSYCFHLLQDHVPEYGNYDVLDDHRHAGLLSREYRSLGLGKLGRRHWAPIRDFVRTVDVIGNELISPTDLDGTPLGECYRAYRQMLDRYHFLTFPLIISHAVEALEDPVIFERVHGSLRYVVVDEYQDINPAQERLIELLAQVPVELCVVGDDDQSIYQWRGSDVRNILTFTERRLAAVSRSLSTNRRSRPGIIAAANAFARTIPDRLPKKMEPKREAAAPELVPWQAETDVTEAERVAETIEELHDGGHRYRDIGVLFRSVRTSAPPLIEALRARDIPYTCGGRTGLFQHPEIALFGETFAWLVEGDWRDERYGKTRKADLDRIVQGLQAHFRLESSAAGLRRYLEDWKAFLLRGIRPINLIGDFYRLLSHLGADKINVDTAEGSARFGAYARFSKLLADYEHVNRRGKYVGEPDGKRAYRRGRDRGRWYLLGLANYLLHYAKDAYEDFEGEATAELDAVDIVTIHQAKGLEWPVVFLPALVSSRFPTRLAGRRQRWLLPETTFPREKQIRYEGGDAEERRLFYVALTRARECVYLSCFERKKNRFTPSPYLKEVAGGALSRDKPLPLSLLPPTPTGPERPALVTSFSEIASFEECGYRFRLASILGWQQELAVELGYGKAIHHVLRQVAERARATGTIPDPETLEQLVENELYLPFADIPALERMHAAALRLVRRYVEHYEGDLRRVWAVERPFELHVPEGSISGRADIILDEEDGRSGSLAIVDYKVAAETVRKGRYRRQLAVYTAAGRSEGLNVTAAYLHELATGSRTSIDVSDARIRAAAGAMAETVASIRTGEFQPHPAIDRCRQCDFRPICKHRARSSVPAA